MQMLSDSILSHIQVQCWGKLNVLQYCVTPEKSNCITLPLHYFFSPCLDLLVLEELFLANVKALSHQK